MFTIQVPMNFKTEIINTRNFIPLQTKNEKFQTA